MDEHRMTSRIFEFGQALPGDDVPVRHERVVRAGIVLLVTMATFMQSLRLAHGGDAPGWGACGVQPAPGAVGMGHEAFWKQHNGCL